MNNRNKLSGGKNTNTSGKNFENKTINKYIIKNGIQINMSKTQHYYVYSINNNEYNLDILYFRQASFKSYIEQNYGIELFRHPDEAYIIINKRVPLFVENITIKILEKKNQNSEGSCETKLWASPSLKEEYSIMFGDLQINIKYGLCLNEFFKQKIEANSNLLSKYQILKKILTNHNIAILYGDDDNYLEQLNNWLLYTV
jgi:hypothetical protein